MDNKFIPEPAGDITNDLHDPAVASFVEFLNSSDSDPNRLAKLEILREDIKLKNDFHITLPNGRTPMMKSSIYAIVTRKMKVNGVRAPKHTTVGQTIEDQVGTVLLDRGLKETNFDRVHKTLYKRYDTEGTAFVIPMVINGKIVTKVVPIDDMYVDPDGNTLLDETNGIHEDNIRWFGFREKLKRATFDKLYPDFKDKVSNGTILQENQDTLDTDGSVDVDIALDEEVQVFHCFSMMTDEPVYCSIAGSSGTRIDLAEGSKYEYRDTNNNPYLPLCVFDFSDEKVGIYSASAVGFVKDGAEALKRNINSGLQNAGRILNAPVYMMGTIDEADTAELENYYQAIEYGEAPVIQRSDPNLNMTMLAPPDISGIVANSKASVMDDLSERLGFQLRRHEDNSSIKVSIYVRQERDESDAIKAIDGRNEDVFLRYFQMIYWMKLRQCPIQTVKLSADDMQFEFKPKAIKEMLNNYEVEFEVDTDLDAKLSFQEKLEANNMIVNDLIGLYQAQIQDETVAKKVGEFRYRKAVMLGEGKHITKQDFIEAAQLEPPINPMGEPGALPAQTGTQPNQSPGGGTANDPLAFQTL